MPALSRTYHHTRPSSTHPLAKPTQINPSSSSTRYTRSLPTQTPSHPLGKPDTYQSSTSCILRAICAMRITHSHTHYPIHPRYTHPTRLLKQSRERLKCHAMP
ncbi:hypothetical protein P171DRAFT_101689 [Karstenula rhodostoma CBS 690.94]|uniref:Uncharacterized protein n=1 Tax=Karstenula rhodostoma CBS 690.94 TaxID=1392251 RepID=A0A9P4PAJ0_9PLEO|nr:hypothetical protein P171DRAFT_101689 [Karstenula rhodostoma CBS 690.94]